jgi:uncharacterized YigZ family protein
MNTYKTVDKKSQSLFKEKGSKFLGFVFPVQSEKDIENYLNDLKESHPKATHHCYAYKLGLEKITYRANDDGEPSNSAGKPILGQIESFDLSNVFIVVVRYYGGTKLGVGGLQTAYKAAAKIALEENIIVEKEIPVFYQLSFPFDKQGIVDHLIKITTGAIIDKTFQNQCEYEVSIPKSNAKQFEEKLFSERSISAIKEN